MKTWFLEESPGAYQWGELPDPEPAAGEVRVRVMASGLNHIDHWQTQGLPKPKVLPHVSGSDGAGVIDAVGEGVTRWSVGDEVVINPAITVREARAELGIDSVLDRSMRILGEHRWGCHGEFVVVPDHSCEPKPPIRTWIDCAAYPVVLSTAWRMLRRARLQPGETVLVTGVGGGVASAAMMLSRHLGAEVFTTSRDAAKRDRSVALGASDSFDSAGDYPVKVDVVVDSIGPATWNQTIKALKRGGRLVTCGGTTGRELTVNLPRLFFEQHEIIGSSLGSEIEFAQATEFMAEGLDALVDSVVPMSEYPAAVERIRGGAQFGKIILDHSA